MNIISKILTGIGLFIVTAGNLATYYAIRVATNGMLTAESSGIGEVAWGMSSAHSYSLASIVGCFILSAGLVLAALSKNQRS